MTSRPEILFLAAFLAVTTACREQQERVTVYCSVDEQFARMILNTFQEQTGIRADAVFDSEAGKTTGLVTRIRAERDRPRADVFFSGELFQTMLLADEGLLAAYKPATAEDIPHGFRDEKNRWVGIGLRGRVLAFDPNRTAIADLPRHWSELADPKWASRLAFANPMFGTTRGHVAAMFARWGREKAVAFLNALHDGRALMVDGNSSAVRAVLDGRADLCMTDTDDVRVAQRNGESLDLTFPDMNHHSIPTPANPSLIGTLWIPSSVALLDDAPHRKHAERLVDFLASADTERLLAKSTSRNLPVRSALRSELARKQHVATFIPYADIAAAMNESADAVRNILLK